MKNVLPIPAVDGVIIRSVCLAISLDPRRASARIGIFDPRGAMLSVVHSMWIASPAWMLQWGASGAIQLGNVDLCRTLAGTSVPNGWWIPAATVGRLWRAIRTLSVVVVWGMSQISVAGALPPRSASTRVIVIDALTTKRRYAAIRVQICPAIVQSAPIEMDVDGAMINYVLQGTPPVHSMTIATSGLIPRVPAVVINVEHLTAVLTV